MRLTDAPFVHNPSKAGEMPIKRLRLGFRALRVAPATPSEASRFGANAGFA
jgi:hypothetical protein